MNAKAKSKLTATVGASVPVAFATASTQAALVDGTDKLLVTSREAAAMLSISERTLWSLTQDGIIPCRRVGRAVRYCISTLKAFAEGKSDGQRCE